MYEPRLLSLFAPPENLLMGMKAETVLRTSDHDIVMS